MLKKAEKSLPIHTNFGDYALPYFQKCSRHVLSYMYIESNVCKYFVIFCPHAGHERVFLSRYSCGTGKPLYITQKNPKGGRSYYARG